ncbi:Abi family protein [Stenotrophomonas sp. 278]|uniref:Abi family protein n=1 Tax=Stenotrophomonas sp. 278 TaxID=2479851 RepID=UPI000F660CF8|nr:Abi family protein [Stenotrophomonas sp. 278]
MTDASYPTATAKPFRDYPELVDMLESRGMIITDRARAIRKIAQVGYFRLSGYWHPSRRFHMERHEGKRILNYLDEFQSNTSFEAVFQFYLMDKSLRILMTDALERIEVYLRTIIAHELGRHDPMAHLDPSNVIRSARTVRDGSSAGALSPHSAWLARHDKLIAQSHEDSIRSHIDASKPIPVWVASEAWNFGAVSKLYSMLTPRHQDSICQRLDILERNVVDNWLINLNAVRNRCAHHARLANRPNPRTLMLPRRGYFNELNLDRHAKDRFYGMVAVVWYLLKAIGPSSDWLVKVADVVDTMPRLPGLTFKSMGFSVEGFPRREFRIAAPAVAQVPTLEEVCSATMDAFVAAKESILAFPESLGTSETRKRFAEGMLDHLVDF